MAMESRNDQRGGRQSETRQPSYGRTASARNAERRVIGEASGPGDLGAARAAVAALEARPRARCLVSQVQTSRGGLITGADEMLSQLLNRSARGFVGTALANLIAGPERKLFGERARMLLEGKDGEEWETRIIAPGARVGVPVALSVERSPDGNLRWYVRDLSELRQAQARVMELEQSLVG
jgi:hypothetical protein